MRCSNKLNFQNRREAEKHADFWFDRNEKMKPYLCNAHRSWHIGHDRASENPATRIHRILEEGDE